MRRFFAVLLLAMLQWPVMSVFALNSESNLPACCWRLGKHKCSMTAQHAGHQGPFFAASQCPSFPGTVATPINQASALNPGIQEVRSTSAVSTAAAIAHDQLPRLVFFREGETRGPPAA